MFVITWRVGEPRRRETQEYQFHIVWVTKGVKYASLNMCLASQNYECRFRF